MLSRLARVVRARYRGVVMTCAEAARKRWASIDSEARRAHMRALAMRHHKLRPDTLWKELKALASRLAKVEAVLSESTGADTRSGFSARLLERK